MKNKIKYGVDWGNSEDNTALAFYNGAEVQVLHGETAEYVARVLSLSDKLQEAVNVLNKTVKDLEELKQ